MKHNERIYINEKRLNNTFSHKNIKKNLIIFEIGRFLVASVYLVNDIVHFSSTCLSLLLLLYVEMIIFGISVMVLNATFNNISVISWRSVLLVEETGAPGVNNRPAASH